MSIYSVLQDQTILPTSNPTTGQNTNTAEEDAEQEKIEFLNLLLTQLSNQNPLDPMDTDEWTAQLTRYSILEQGIDTNKNLTEISEMLQNSSSSQAFSYIGKEVEIPSNATVARNGEATWTYLVYGGDASEVTLTVTDAEGNIYDTFDGSIESGAHEFTFNATDYDIEDGTSLFFNVNAVDSDDESLEKGITSYATVDGVWSDGSTTYLTAGSLSFDMTDVLKISNGTEIASTETDETTTE